MTRSAAVLVEDLEFGQVARTPSVPRGAASRPAPLDRLFGDRDKYRILDLKRRRAQIRARRELGLV